MDMIKEMKETLKMEIRPNSKDVEYLEAVVSRGGLDPLLSILKKYLGAAAKEPGKEVALPKEIQRKVDALGGLRKEQSFFYKKEKGALIFAALWPWESNPDKITLKSGSTAL